MCTRKPVYVEKRPNKEIWRESMVKTKQRKLEGKKIDPIISKLIPLEL